MEVFKGWYMMESTNALVQLRRLQLVLSVGDKKIRYQVNEIVGE